MVWKSIGSSLSIYLNIFIWVAISTLLVHNSCKSSVDLCDLETANLLLLLLFSCKLLIASNCQCECCILPFLHFFLAIKSSYQQLSRMLSINALQ